MTRHLPVARRIRTTRRARVCRHSAKLVIANRLASAALDHLLANIRQQEIDEVELRRRIAAWYGIVVRETATYRVVSDPQGLGDTVIDWEDS